MSNSLPRLAAERLTESRSILGRSKILVGFDGFVDTILHVVDQRESATKYTRLDKMGEFGRRIQAAAGKSANLEFVEQMVKLGGNGPIMANALAQFTPPVTYVGSLGYPNLHPVFDAFAKTTRVISISEPGYTDAVEFNDGKLMFGKHASLKHINWQNLLKHIGEPDIVKLFSDCAMIAMVNWTMLPSMTAIFNKVLTRVAPMLEGPRRWVFFDLADPAKRAPEDIQTALKTISKFEKNFRVILGLNFSESVQIGGVLGIKRPAESLPAVAAHAAAIREKLGLDTVVVHPTHFAAAADASGHSALSGPFTPKPKITTGAGDHFNAGFCLGRLLECDIPMSLQFGVATSGYYVRHARSPKMEDLKKFLRSM